MRVWTPFHFGTTSMGRNGMWSPAERSNWFISRLPFTVFYFYQCGGGVLAYLGIQKRKLKLKQKWLNLVKSYKLKLFIFFRIFIQFQFLFFTNHCYDFLKCAFFMLIHFMGGETYKFGVGYGLPNCIACGFCRVEKELLFLVF